MNSVSAPPPEIDANYGKFIREAFLDPIRSVLVVDDEYPTLDEFLAEERESPDPGLASLMKNKESNRNALLKFINFCRTRTPRSWMVDVHDGRTPPLSGEKDGAARFEHSDLLILDYHLEGNNGNEKALEIIQAMASNGRFNLVVVYTKDRDGLGRGIDTAIREITLSLTSPVEAFNLHDAQVANQRRKFSIWEDTESGIYSKLIDCMDQSAYLKAVSMDDRTWDNLNKFPEFTQFITHLNAIPDSVGLTADEVIKHLLHTRQSTLKSSMLSRPNSLAIASRGSEGENWIRTDSLFVTVVSKKDHEPDKILDQLEKALIASNPNPHRLMMSKMRNEITNQGVMAEASVLGNKYLQIAWLKEMLENDISQRTINVKLNVARHWEELAGQLENPIVDYAKSLSNYLLSLGGTTDVLKSYGLEEAAKEQIQIYLHQNAYICSKPLEGYHLTTGHVLMINPLKKGKPEFWVCLSPACDLVPGQGLEKGWRKRTAPWLPFKAVRLFETKPKNALEDATRGNHLFLKIKGQVQAFGLSDFRIGTNHDLPALRWEQCYVDNNGVWTDQYKLSVSCLRTEQGKLKFDTHNAEVVAQLRYEYALSLLSRLGSHLSRIGLDFQHIPIEDSKIQEMHNPALPIIPIMPENLPN